MNCESISRNKYTVTVLTMTGSLHIPLFPLATVLFPGGVLPLRIFEPRYLDMVGSCMREDSGFGVVLITEGRDAGEAAQFHATGTLARIEDFDQLDDGHLGITCRGVHRFRVLRSAVRDNQLVVADIEPLGEQQSPRLPERYDDMRAFLQGLYQREELREWAATLTPEWDSGQWLASRLIEVLPLASEGRQALLEMEVEERLANLERVMDQNGMF